MSPKDPAWTECDLHAAIQVRGSDPRPVVRLAPVCCSLIVLYGPNQFHEFAADIQGGTAGFETPLPCICLTG